MLLADGSDMTREMEDGGKNLEEKEEKEKKETKEFVGCTESLSIFDRLNSYMPLEQVSPASPSMSAPKSQLTSRALSCDELQQTENVRVRKRRISQDRSTLVDKVRCVLRSKRYLMILLAAMWTLNSSLYGHC